MPENVGELLQREKSMQFDSLTEEPNAAQYEKTSMPQSSVESKGSMSNWMQVLMLAEKESVTYSYDYCTLSHTQSEHVDNTHKS